MLVSKHYDYNIFVKCLVKCVKQGPLYDVIFQRSSKHFQSNISRPNNNRNFSTSSHLRFQEIKSNSLVNFSEFWNIYFFVPSLSSNRVKSAQSCISCIKGNRKIEINIWWNFEMRIVSEITFSRCCSFDSRGDVINPKMHEKGPYWYFMYQCW